nr:synaptotagmin-4-like isoform X2 [Ipomoea batatas]GMD92100.1 synaptotagmin-4-like isoform X2 [Ipomoea batatas]
MYVLETTGGSSRRSQVRCSVGDGLEAAVDVDVVFAVQYRFSLLLEIDLPLAILTRRWSGGSLFVVDSGIGAGVGVVGSGLGAVGSGLSKAGRLLEWLWTKS